MKQIQKNAVFADLFENCFTSENEDENKLQDTDPTHKNQNQIKINSLPIQSLRNKTDNILAYKQKKPRARPYNEQNFQKPYVKISSVPSKPP
jgi:hypothetical protein